MAYIPLPTYEFVLLVEPPKVVGWKPLLLEVSWAQNPHFGGQTEGLYFPLISPLFASTKRWQICISAKGSLTDCNLISLEVVNRS